MSHFGLKINKTELPDKTPYTIYYPHDKPLEDRNWVEDYLQVVSIDPATKNFAMRIEKRYNNGTIIPIVFDKVSLKNKEDIETDNCITYNNLTNFLNKYKHFYNDCHYIIIERQLPQNYKATRIAQHTITYFLLNLSNNDLLSSIIEIDSKIKGKMLGAPPRSTDRELKMWAVTKARELLEMRKDDFSIGVLNHFKTKQDDLSDTICQIEAFFKLQGFPLTIECEKVPSNKKISLNIKNKNKHSE